MQETFERGWTQVLAEGPFVAVASHNGHELRPEVRDLGKYAAFRRVRQGGDKLMETNVFSPGGLGSAQKFENVNFSEAVMQALERKTRAMEYYGRQFDNASMAIM